MMNRDRITRGRSSMSSATTFGLDERLERILLYPISVLLILFAPFGWLLAILLNVAVSYIEKNRNVRWNAWHAAAIFGFLGLVYTVINLLIWLLGGIILIGGLIHIGLGLLASIVWWVVIIVGVYLTIMAWFNARPRVPFLTNLVETFFGRWM